MTDILTDVAGTSMGNRGVISGYLKRIKSDPVGELIPLIEPKVIIGRHRDSTIYIHDVNISRSHCVLKHSSSGWSIADNETVNGTYLDGERLEKRVAVKLRDGVAIYLGPPQHASAGFVFFSQKPEIQVHNLSTACKAENAISSVCLPMKRTQNSSQLDKRILPVNSTTTCTNGSNSYDDVVEECHSDDSMDSLNTRILKRNCKLQKKEKPTKPKTVSILQPVYLDGDINCNPSILKKETVHSRDSVSRNSSQCKVENNHFVRSKEKGDRFAQCKTLLDKLLHDDGDTSSPSPSDSDSLLQVKEAMEDSYPFSFRLSPNKGRLSEGGASSLQKDTTTNDQEWALRGKVCNLQEQLEKSQATLEKVLQDNKQLSNLLQKISQERNSTDMKKAELKGLLEDELLCNICTEILIKPIVLRCSHTFCEHCIHEWMRKKMQCPMCRVRIESETRVLVLESFICKCMEVFDDDHVRKWKDVKLQREIVKVPPKKRKKQKRSPYQAHRRRRIRLPPPRMPLEELISMTAAPEVIEIDDNEVDTTETESSVDGNHRFDTCYNCGNRGHWANRCPLL